MAQIIDGLTVDFENQDKKRMDDIDPEKVTDFKVKITGLRENDKLRFKAGRLMLTP